MTSESDINAMCKGIKNYKGIFMRTDKLPLRGKFILNLDARVDKNGNQRPGTHWVAVDATNGVYADPFGSPYPDEVAHIVHKYMDGPPVQKLTEDNCGQLSCYILRHLSNSDKKNQAIYNSLLKK
jgi:hypothetical protein